MKRITLSIMSAAAVILFGTGIATAAPNVITLKVAHFLPP